MCVCVFNEARQLPHPCREAFGCGSETSSQCFMQAKTNRKRTPHKTHRWESCLFIHLIYLLSLNNAVLWHSQMGPRVVCMPWGKHVVRPYVCERDTYIRCKPKYTPHRGSLSTINRSQWRVQECFYNHVIHSHLQNCQPRSIQPTPSWCSPQLH